MKKLICGTVSLVMMFCAVSCGSHAVSNSGVKVTAETFSNRSTEEITDEVTGNWETSYELLDGLETEKIPRTYTFEADGTGTYTPQDGVSQRISWEVTPLGGIQVLYEEMGERTESFSFVGSDLVTVTDTVGGEREIHIAPASSLKNEKNSQ